MDKDFSKQYSYPGSIFVDHRCDFNNMFEAAHQVIYGHNMKNGTMFQQLTRYQDEAFFNENRYINVSTLYGDYVFEVFAAYETPITYYYLETSFPDRQKWLEFIKGFQVRSDFETDIVLSGKDVVLTLSTCTNRHDDDYRYVVQARLTNPERYDMVYDYIYTNPYE
jgi:sortase B